MAAIGMDGVPSNVDVAGRSPSNDSSSSLNQLLATAFSFVQLCLIASSTIPCQPPPTSRMRLISVLHYQPVSLATAGPTMQSQQCERKSNSLTMDGVQNGMSSAPSPFRDEPQGTTARADSSVVCNLATIPLMVASAFLTFAPQKSISSLARATSATSSSTSTSSPSRRRSPMVLSSPIACR